MDTNLTVKTKISRSIGLKTFPEGSVGTVVKAFRTIEAFDVEFSKPCKGIVFYRASDLEFL